MGIKYGHQVSILKIQLSPTTPKLDIIQILCNHVYGQYARTVIFAIWPPLGGHLDNQTFDILEVEYYFHSFETVAIILNIIPIHVKVNVRVGSLAASASWFRQGSFKIIHHHQTIHTIAK
jgi:hypothetical protein